MLITPNLLSPVSLLQAKKAQEQMQKKVLLVDDFKTPISLIGGMDVSNQLYDPDEMIYASCVLLSYPTLDVVETKATSEKQTFPYIPGFLGFREAPALVHAYEKVIAKPDVIFVDEQGVSHPRGLGIASHVGVLLDVPTIGVAKSILVGHPEKPLGEEVGSTTSLVYKRKEIGILLRSKKNCLPLIISAGHRITLKTALEIVLTCFRKYRLPEPTRQAHLAANAARRSSLSSVASLR